MDGEEIEISQIQILSNFVKGAIVSLKEGDNKSYSELVQLFLNKRDDKDPKKLIVWLKALSQHVSMMDKYCTNLIDTILKYNWIVEDEEFYEVYSQFLTNLLSAQPSYTARTFVMLMEYLKYSSGKGKEESSIVFTRVHILLRKLLLLIPTAAIVLHNTVIDIFPRKRASIESLKNFSSNLLTIMDYLPFSRDQIFTVIMEKVEIQVEVEELNLQDIEEGNEDIFDMELNEKEEENDDSDSDDGGVNEDNDGSKVTIMVKKLDIMMDLIFKYTTRISRDENEFRDFFSANVKIFETMILRTFKSRYCQFLMFYLCSKNVFFTNSVLGRLYNIATTSNEPYIIKLAASSYLGSFIARAKFLTNEYLFTLASMLTSWLNDYTTLYEHEEDLQFNLHHQFYGVTQAVLYIFCFRWRVFKNTGGDGNDPWHPSISVLRHILNSNLNPLRNCAEVIVNMFAEISHKVDFMYCYSIIEKNRATFVAQLKVDTFFPFDPYQLPSTLHLIEPLYGEFEPVEENETSNKITDSEILIGSINSPLLFAHPLHRKVAQLSSMAKISTSIEDMESMQLEDSFMSMSISPSFQLSK